MCPKLCPVWRHTTKCKVESLMASFSMRREVYGSDFMCKMFPVKRSITMQKAHPLHQRLQGSVLSHWWSQIKHCGRQKFWRLGFSQFAVIVFLFPGSHWCLLDFLHPIDWTPDINEGWLMSRVLWSDYGLWFARQKRNKQIMVDLTLSLFPWSSTCCSRKNQSFSHLGSWRHCNQ